MEMHLFRSAGQRCLHYGVVQTAHQHCEISAFPSGLSALPLVHAFPLMSPALLVEEYSEIRRFRIHIYALELPRLVVGPLVRVEGEVAQSLERERLVPRGRALGHALGRGEV